MCAAISDTLRRVVYTLTDQPATNKISLDSSVTNPVTQIPLCTTTLNSILEEYHVGNNDIDLLSIDVEGHELNVLKSIDLKRYKVKLICVEIHGLDLKDLFHNQIVELLTKNDYRFVTYFVMNAYFLRQD